MTCEFLLQLKSRLLERLGIFKSSLGDPEPIIGEQIQKLEAYLLTAKRTQEEEEAEINRTAQTLENIRHKQEELARNAAQMIAHGGLILDKIEALRFNYRQRWQRSLMNLFDLTE